MVQPWSEYTKYGIIHDVLRILYIMMHKSVSPASILAKQDPILAA